MEGHYPQAGMTHHFQDFPHQTRRHGLGAQHRRRVGSWRLHLAGRRRAPEHQGGTAAVSARSNSYYETDDAAQRENHGRALGRFSRQLLDGGALKRLGRVLSVHYQALPSLKTSFGRRRNRASGGLWYATLSINVKIPGNPRRGNA